VRFGGVEKVCEYSHMYLLKLRIEKKVLMSGVGLGWMMLRLRFGR
jgi:hypothetical protein